MGGKNYMQAAIEAFTARHPEIKLSASPVSEKDMARLEEKFHIAMPGAVKAYLQSYTFPVPLVTGKMLGDFSKTYCEETGRWREMEAGEEIATVILQMPFMLPDFDFRNFEESNRSFAGTGYLWLGLYNEECYVLLELQSGKIWRVDMERVRLASADETKADILRWALPFFHSFEDLARCFFAGGLYDEEEMVFVE